MTDSDWQFGELIDNRPVVPTFLTNTTNQDKVNMSYLPKPDLFIAVGDQLCATLRLAIVANQINQSEEFALKVIGPLTETLDYIREIKKTEPQ